jgi:uracil-DNA glycosylase family 4
MSAWEEGSDKAEICYVAEAPGRVEMARGRPLVGPAGSIAEECSHHAGIARAEVRIINAFPYQVRKTNAGSIVHPHDGEVLWTTKGFTKRGLSEVQGSMDLIARSQANCFVAMGAPALSLLTEKSGITKWRGSVLMGLNDRKVVPTIHPAACMYSGDKVALKGYTSSYCLRYSIIEDLIKAKTESKFRDLRRMSRDLICSPTYKQTLEFLAELHKAKKPVNFDIECPGGALTCISFANVINQAMSIPFVSEHGESYWPEDQEVKIWNAIAGILGDESIVKVNQNILFDIDFLSRFHGIRTRGVLLDPMVAHKIIYPDLPAGLDYLCSIYTDQPYYKDQGRMWGSGTATFSDHYEYNARDSVIALECWEKIEPELTEGYRQPFELTMRMLPALSFMMSRGIRVNKLGLADVKMQIATEMVELQEKFEETADYVFNWRSSKQCQEYFYGTKKIKPYINQGRPTCDDIALSRLFRTHHLYEANLIQQMRRLTKLTNNYLEVSLDWDGRLRCSYNPAGTNSGRLSSSTTVFGTGTNMQNLHPAFLPLLCAD